MSVQETVEAHLRDKLGPEHLEVVNESHMHSVPALAITSRTPAEWAASPEANVSPQCASKK